MMSHFLKSRVLLILCIFLGLGSLVAAGYLFAQGEYVVYEDGQPIGTASGHYQTVAQVLTAVGVQLRPEDVVWPSLTQSPAPHIQINRAKAVTVRTKTGTQTYFTQQPNIAAFLAEIDLIPTATDPLFADGIKASPESWAARPLPRTLEIGRFVTITITDGRQRQTLRTAVPTVGAALQEANIVLQSIDTVTPARNTPLEPGLLIEIRRAFEVTLQVDGRTMTTRTTHPRAQDVLAENGVTLVGLDYARPGPERNLQPNDVIHVIRVTEDFRVQDEPIPFQTVYQANDQLEIDTQAIVSAGMPGIKRQRVRIRYENGMPVSETIDAEWVAREPVNEVVGYGANIVPRTLNTPDGLIEYWRVVRMRVTSYTAASSGKPLAAPDYGITASGLTAQRGVVAVDRSIVPWKTWVYVPGYGFGYAGDTGGGVHGRWIDLGYEEETFIPWSGYVDVYYLTPIPPPEDINFLLPVELP